MTLDEAIESNFDDLPKPVKPAWLEHKGIVCGYCSVEGEIDPTCVWDENNPEDCMRASNGTKKADCDHWNIIETCEL